MSLLWSERISPIFLAINLLLLWSKKSHFSQTTSLKKSKKFPDFRIFFPCPQRGQNVNRNCCEKWNQSSRGAKSNITCGRKWHIKGYHSSFFLSLRRKGVKLVPQHRRKELSLRVFASLRNFHFFFADLNRKNSADLFLLICGIFP